MNSFSKFKRWFSAPSGLRNGFAVSLIVMVWAQAGFMLYEELTANSEMKMLRECIDSGQAFCQNNDWTVEIIYEDTV